MNKVCSFLYKNYMSPKRKQVLNSLVSHLKDNALLPPYASSSRENKLKSLLEK